MDLRGCIGSFNQGFVQVLLKQTSSGSILFKLQPSFLLSIQPRERENFSPILCGKSDIVLQYSPAWLLKGGLNRDLCSCLYILYMLLCMLGVCLCAFVQHIYCGRVYVVCWCIQYNVNGICVFFSLFMCFIHVFIHLSVFALSVSLSLASNT